MSTNFSANRISSINADVKWMDSYTMILKKKNGFGFSLNGSSPVYVSRINPGMLCNSVGVIQVYGEISNGRILNPFCKIGKILIRRIVNWNLLNLMQYWEILVHNPSNSSRFSWYGYSAVYSDNFLYKGVFVCNLIRIRVGPI